MSDQVAKLLAFIGANRAFPAAMELQPQQLGFAGVYFSLAGEDAALRQIYKHQINTRKPGIYVDIGCNHPGFISNTYMFYCYGWRGLCVDADSDLTTEWGMVRPRDTFVSTAVGEKAGPAFLVKHKTNAGQHFVQDSDRSRGPDFHPARAVSVRRLDDLFEQYLSGVSIDLLSMDIEGSELGALKSNDWKRWAPATIILECIDFDFLSPTATATVSFLIERGYRLHSKIGGNVIMVAA